MSLLNAIAEIAAISISVLIEVSEKKLNPYRIGDLYYFYDRGIDGVRCFNLGPEQTLAYVKIDENDRVVTRFIPLEKFGRYDASKDISEFAAGNVSITATTPIETASGDRSGRARLLFSIPILTVSTFLFFDQHFEFKVTSSGFLIKATQATEFDRARLEYKDESGARFELAMSPPCSPGLDEASAESPSGSAPQLPLQDVEISLELSREDFDKITEPRRELVTVSDKNDVPPFLLA